MINSTNLHPISHRFHVISIAAKHSSVAGAQAKMNAADAVQHCYTVQDR